MEIIFEMNILLIIGLPLWIIIRGVILLFRRKKGDKLNLYKEIITNLFVIYLFILIGVTIFPLRIGSTIPYLSNMSILERYNINLIPFVDYYKNNISGTITLLEKMKEYDVKNIVFSSSATVYGTNNPSPMTEDMPTSAINPYGYTKLMMEQILTDVAASDPSWSVTNLRYFNPIGAHESGLIGELPNGIPNNLMPYITQVAIGKLPELNVFGDDYPTPDGTGVRDYIHVLDLASGHLAAVKYNLSHKGAEIFNLGTGHGYSVLDLVKTFEAENKVTIPYRIQGRRAGDIATCYASPEKAKEVLGWEAKKTLKDMVRDSWRWQTTNPNGYED